MTADGMITKGEIERVREAGEDWYGVPLMSWRLEWEPHSGGRLTLTTLINH